MGSGQVVGGQDRAILISSVALRLWNNNPKSRGVVDQVERPSIPGLMWSGRREIGNLEMGLHGVTRRCNRLTLASMTVMRL